MVPKARSAFRPGEAWCDGSSLGQSAIQFLERLLKDFRASSGTLAILDPYRRKLRVLASFGLSPLRLQQSSYLPLRGVSAYVLKQKEAVFMGVSCNPPLSLGYERKRDVSSVCFPLKDARGRVLGMLSLNRREGFFDPLVLPLLEKATQKYLKFLEELKRAVEEERTIVAVQQASRVIGNIDSTVGLQDVARKVLQAFKIVVPVQYAVFFVLLPDGESAFAMSRGASRLLSPRLRGELDKIFAPLFKKKGLTVHSVSNIPGLQDVLPVDGSLKVLTLPLHGREYFWGAFMALVEDVPGEFSQASLATLGNTVVGVLQNFVLVKRIRRYTIERERLRIAQDLHDRIAQDLAGAEMYCRALQEALFKERALGTEETSLLQHLESFLTSCAQEVRKTLKELRGEVPDWDLSLKEALLAKLNHLFDPQGVQHNLRVKTSQEDLPLFVRREVLLILEECLVNVWKHAQATSLRVTIGRHKNRIYFSVWDNGKGFCPEEALLEKNSFGLRGIAERVASLGGILRIHSVPRRGTKIGVMLPVTW